MVSLLLFLLSVKRLLTKYSACCLHFVTVFCFNLENILTTLLRDKGDFLIGIRNSSLGLENLTWFFKKAYSFELLKLKKFLIVFDQLKKNLWNCFKKLLVECLN